ncbi:MAG: HEAT repeat domain-containing protein [Actinobacteria bacterium]|nr:HEAT repeat domain-containing protein [Actinomycetota bacterium]
MSTPTPSWRALAEAGHTGDEAAARLGWTSDDPASRELAIGALLRMGALTDDDLRNAMTDPHHGVRRRAVMIAGTRPSIHLLASLRDAEPTVVEAAAWAAGEQETTDDDVVERLVELATGAADPLVREAAVAALGAIGDERGLPAILAGCSDKPNIRRRAVLALAPFEGPEVDAALATALEDRDWQVRQAAEDLAPFMSDD